MANFEEKKQDNKTGGTTSKTSGQQDKLGDKVSTAEHGDTEAAKDIYNQAKESVGKVYGVASEKAASKIDEQKTHLAQGISSVADTIRQIGGNLQDAENPNSVADATAKYSNTVADKVEQLSGYFEEKELREVMRDVEDFAHRQPVLFLGGAFALGVLAARFLKSSNQNRGSNRSSSRKGYLAKDSEGVHLPEDLDKQIKSNRDGIHLPENLDEQVKANSEGVHLPEDLDEQIKSKNNQADSSGSQSAQTAK